MITPDKCHNAARCQVIHVQNMERTEDKKETVVCRRHEPRMMKTEPMTRHTCAHTHHILLLECCWKAQDTQQTSPWNGFNLPRQ